MKRPAVSVVIPLFNEEDVLERLFDRLYPAMDALGTHYEVVLVDDASRDRSAELVRAQFEKRPAHTRAVFLAFNVGQHMAILAGFSHARGERIVTLDADLQNPPEEIGKLLRMMDRGHDYVGGVRRDRQDSWWRTHASKCLNWLRAKTTRIRLTDQGCMLPDEPVLLHRRRDHFTAGRRPYLQESIRVVHRPGFERRRFEEGEEARIERDRDDEDAGGGERVQRLVEQ